MSASSTPTFNPLAARPSAMLTAVVDLPTPPLPEATAMIASMPGTPRLPWLCEAGACGAARGAGGGAAGRGRGRARRDRRFHAAALLLGGQRNDRAGHAGDGLDHALGGGAQRLQLLGAGGRNGDREEHLCVGDEDVGDHAEADDVALEVRTAHGLQAFDHGFLGHGHRHGFPVLFGLT